MAATAALIAALLYGAWHRPALAVLVAAITGGWAIARLRHVWIWFDHGMLWAHPADDARISLLGFLPVIALVMIPLALRRERMALHAGERVGPRLWRFRVRGVDVHVARVASRILPSHDVVARLPLEDARVRGWARGSSAFPPRPWHFEGPAHLETVWLAGDVPDRLVPLLRRRDAKVEGGELRVRLTRRFDAGRLSAVVAEVAAVVEAVRASGGGAVGRIQAEARSVGDELRRIEAWRTLADHLPHGLAALAPEGLHDANPVIRVIAARALDDRGVIAEVLARSNDEEAVRRAAEAVRLEGWSELVDLAAGRIGGLSEGAWYELIRVVAHLGTAAHVPGLREVADGPGFAPELRAAARDGIARIRERIGGEAAGRVGLAAGESGQLALAAEGGEVSVVDSVRSRS